MLLYSEEMPSAPSKDQNGVIKLNVGGRRYDTSVETLLRHGDNMLSSLVQYRNSMLGGWKGEPGNKEIFIDRNGSRFCYILDYMRDRKLPSFHHIWQYEEILIEANFFQLDGLIRLCQNGIDKLLTKEKNKSIRIVATDIISAYKCLERSYRLRDRNNSNISHPFQAEQFEFEAERCGLEAEICSDGGSNRSQFSLGPEAFAPPDSY